LGGDKEAIVGEPAAKVMMTAVETVSLSNVAETCAVPARQDVSVTDAFPPLVPAEEADRFP
jgi:hypothetical protein